MGLWKPHWKSQSNLILGKLWFPGDHWAPDRCLKEKKVKKFDQETMASSLQGGLREAQGAAHVCMNETLKAIISTFFFQDHCTLLEVWCP